MWQFDPPIFQASGTFLSHPSQAMWKIYTLLLQKKVYIDAPCKIESPVAYFLFSQQPLGGWPRFSIPHTSFADYSIFGLYINFIFQRFNFVYDPKNEAIKINTSNFLVSFLKCCSADSLLEDGLVSQSPILLLLPTLFWVQT